MKQKYLFINTINPDLPSFALFSGEGDAVAVGFIGKQERLNEKLGAFFKKNRIRPEGLKAVLAIGGPGSFSASRAGVVLANSFHFLHKTPVWGIKNEAGAKFADIIKKYLPKLEKIPKNSQAKVLYDHEPNIIMPKL